MALFTRTYTLIGNNSGAAEIETGNLGQLILEHIVFRIPSQESGRQRPRAGFNCVVTDTYLDGSIASLLTLVNQFYNEAATGVKADALTYSAWTYAYPSVDDSTWADSNFALPYRPPKGLSISLSDAGASRELDVELILTDGEAYQPDVYYSGFIPEGFVILR